MIPKPLYLKQLRIDDSAYFASQWGCDIFVHSQRVKVCIRQEGEVERETVDAVLEFYGDELAIWLRDLSHMENPWKDARNEASLAKGQRGQAIISQASMAEYYSSI